MGRELEIVIQDNGTMSIEGNNLKPGEAVKDVAKFLTDKLGEVTEFGHKHTHKIAEQSRETLRNS